MKESIDCKWKFPKLDYMEEDNPALAWVSNDQYVDWLPFEDQKDLDETYKYLERKMISICWRYYREEDDDDHRSFEYVPVLLLMKISDKYPMESKKEMNIISFRWKIGKVYLDEKQS